jgi:ribosomal protein L7/L12
MSLETSLTSVWWVCTGAVVLALVAITVWQGTRLRQLRERVERLERDSYGGAPPAPTGSSAPVGSMVVTSLEGLSDEQGEHLRRLLRQRQKIQAIKDVREWTGIGLKESKDYVEALEAQMKAQGDL